MNKHALRVWKSGLYHKIEIFDEERVAANEKVQRFLKLLKEQNEITAKREYHEGNYHEAGHAVVGNVLGVRFDKIKIDIGGKGAGYAELSKSEDAFSGFYLKDPLRCRLLLLYAGMVSTIYRFSEESWFFVDDELKSARKDMEKADEAICAIFPDIPKEEQISLADFMKGRTLLFVSEPLIWSLIDAVARVLYEKKEINGTELVDIIAEHADEDKIQKTVEKMLNEFMEKGD